ncbi:MFS transporter [Mesorhizobium sp. M0228]|uniref:MFS transporter n=1 Tax=unclassified Mesorhizobium TaxID=325217 RepID=UPI003339D5D8
MTDQLNMSHHSSVADVSARPRFSLVLTLLAFAQLIISIDYNIVFVALPEIGLGLGFSAQTLQWVVSAYAVAFGGFLLLGGRASDLLGRRRMFVFGLVLYAVSSLVGGFATTPQILIAARAVQGLGGAFLFPATLSLVNTTFSEGRERNIALSVWAGSGAGGMVLGSLLGGVLTQAFGWEAVFFVNVPLAGIAIVAAFPVILGDSGYQSGGKFDLPGALTATVGTTLLVFTLVQGPEYGWASQGILVSAAVGILLLALFVAIEAHSRDPLLPLRLLANRNLSTGVVTTFLFTATFGSLLYFLSFYFQTVQGFGVLQTGFAFMVPMLAVLSGNALSGRMATRLGTRNTLVISLAIGAIGTAALGMAMSADSTYADLVPGLIVFSLGGGITFPTMFAAAAKGVAAHEQGIASGIASTGQQVGSAVGLAILVAVANAGTGGLTGEALRVATAEGVRMAVYLAAAGTAAMILVALNFRRH